MYPFAFSLHRFGIINSLTSFIFFEQNMPWLSIFLRYIYWGVKHWTFLVGQRVRRFQPILINAISLILFSIWSFKIQQIRDLFCSLNCSPMFLEFGSLRFEQLAQSNCVNDVTKIEWETACRIGELDLCHTTAILFLMCTSMRTRVRLLVQAGWYPFSCSDKTTRFFL